MVLFGVSANAHHLKNCVLLCSRYGRLTLNRAQAAVAVGIGVCLAATAGMALLGYVTFPGTIAASQPGSARH